ncbi:MAG: BtaA family protein [Saprospiraceae bacterium]|nr:BtaA family protein [Lewinella sp.]
MTKKIDRLQDWVFRQIHNRHLVYNTCWEDPRCDREMLQLQPDSNVVMITSAGCNALDYLLDHPARINCIDVNPRQNALLALKIAALKHLPHNDLFLVFGKGWHPEWKELYQRILRSELPDYARQYWDDHLSYFNGQGLRKSFYFYGSSGSVAWWARQYLKARPKLHARIERLFNAQDLEEQNKLYHKIEKKLLNRLIQWVVNQHLTLYAVGVPRSQRELFFDQHEEGVLGYIRRSMRQVFTELPLKDNYFWQLYFHGCYFLDCCPSYLKAANQPILASKSDRIHQYTTTISQYLRTHPDNYSHYVLLDHQDWLAANNRPALEEEWELILANSRPGTRILMRSAADVIDFLPDFVRERVAFDQAMAESFHAQDRVGTYGSAYIGTVL